MEWNEQLEWEIVFIGNFIRESKQWQNEQRDIKKTEEFSQIIKSKEIFKE